MEKFTINISATAVAWYGAVVATISVIISLFIALRDRARIKIEFIPETRVERSRHYDPGKKYLNIVVRNAGRRPVRIGNVALRAYRTKGFHLVSDSILNINNQILTEENPRTNFLVEYDEKIPSEILYVEVYDEAGRKYIKYYPPRFKSFTKSLLSYFLKKNE